MKKLFILLFTFILCGSLFAQKKENKKELPTLVSKSWLNSNLNNPRLVIIDLRTKELFDKGHIKNAINIPGLQNLFDKKLFMPKLNLLTEMLSEAGINHNSLVVAYDEGVFFWAARFYWILETLGHNNVGLLEVGYKNWQISKLPSETIAYKAKKTIFVPRVNSEKLQTKLSTLLAIGKKTIIDGRSRTHYLGKDSLTKRYGHIPSAKNYACSNNFQVTNNGNKMKNLTVLADVYKNLPKDKEIIIYCDGGAEAALNYIVLQELGYKASVYDGSWAEWGNDEYVPIENPSKNK